MKKPSGATGNITHTVQVSTTENGFVENDAGFEITYGPENQKYFFFEGVASSVDLPYYHAVRNPYEWTINVETPFNSKAYADTFYYSGSSAGWPYEGGYFEIMTPETSSWISNGTVYNREIDFNFDNLGNPLVKADGTWRLRIEAEETGTYPGATIILQYWYEL